MTGIRIGIQDPNSGHSSWSSSHCETMGQLAYSGYYAGWLAILIVHVCSILLSRFQEKIWSTLVGSRGVFIQDDTFFLIYHRMSWVIWKITCMHSFVWSVFPCNCWICFPQNIETFCIFSPRDTVTPARPVTFWDKVLQIWASRFPHGLASYFTRHQLRLKPILVYDEWWLLKIDQDRSSWVYFFDSDDSRKNRKAILDVPSYSPHQHPGQGTTCTSWGYDEINLNCNLAITVGIQLWTWLLGITGYFHGIKNSTHGVLLVLVLITGKGP